jgi:predicted PurR-regulated permease PerM
VTQTQSFLTSLVVVIALVYFLLASGDLFLRKLVKVLPNFTEKKRAVEIFRRVEDDISHYLLTATLINAGLGTVTALALYLLGMPNVMLGGVMVALLNFIPYLGAVVNFIILAVVAILTFDDLSHALLVPSVFLILTTLEGQFITPTILGRSLTLSPVVIFIGLIFWMWMWGIAGAILAVPILAVIEIFCDSFEFLAPIGEFLGR